MSSRFEETLSGVFEISFYFGVFPVRKHHGVNYEYSRVSYCYGISLALLTICQFLYEENGFLNMFSLSVRILTDLIVYKIYFITWVIILMQCFILKNTIPIIILELKEINSRLTLATYNRFFKFVVIFITVLNVASKFLNYIRGWSSWIYFLTVILNFLPISAPLLVAGQYAVLLYIIGRQMVAITEQLDTAKNYHEIRGIADIHHSLCEIAGRINNAYDIFLLNLIMLLFIANVSGLYRVILLIFEPRRGEVELYTLAVLLLDVLANAGIIILIVTLSMKAANSTTLSAAFNFSFLFGVFPMRKLHGMTYEFSKIFYCYDIFAGIMTTSGCFFAGLLYMDNKGVDDMKLLMDQYLDLIIFNAYSINWLIIIIRNYVRRKSLPDIISELDEINSSLKKASYNFFFNASIIFITILNTASKMIYFSRRPFSWHYFIGVILYFFSINVPVVVAGQYAVLLYIISRQHVAITEQLDNGSDKNETRRLADIHHSLCNVAKRINDSYDIFLLCVITLSFITNVLKIYIIISYIIVPEIDILSTCGLLIDILINGSTILLIVTPALNARDNADKFNAQLLKNLMLNKVDISNDNTLRTYLCMKNQINQTACQFFSLDYRLLTSMAAVTTTYVILLVQFTLVQ